MVYSYLIGGETPRGVEMQKQRREHVVKKLIEKLPDPPDEHDEGNTSFQYHPPYEYHPFSILKKITIYDIISTQ